MAFDFLFNQLRDFLPMVSATNLTTTLANHFDVNHSIARVETATVLASVKSALFRCENLSGIRFLNRRGKPVGVISDDPSKTR
jgi:hypothetical protein